MTDNSMNCEQFDAQLADYFENTLTPRVRRAMDAHASSCLRCAAIVRDIEGIRHQAAHLPELEPSHDLWDGIAARIEAPVIRLEPTPVQRAVSFRTLRLTAVAAGLVIVTAGVTWMLANRGTATPQVATQSDASAPAVSTPMSPAATAPTAAPTTTLASARAARPTAEVTYDMEIARLRGILDLRRNDLDSSTVAVLSLSLATIDRAIADARAALARDSASGFLNEQLNRALEKKLGLLRTVALLPTRT